MSNDLFDDLNLQPSKNEAGWHPAVKNSFVFLPSAGMRVSSDDLIIELYRELFYEKWYKIYIATFRLQQYFNRMYDNPDYKFCRDRLEKLFSAE